MASHAEACVASFAASGSALDFSIASVEIMEAAVASAVASIAAITSPERRARAFRVIMTSWGCYVGEVIRRAVGGIWVRRPNGLGVTLPGGGLPFPHNKVSKRLQGGPDDTIAGFVQAMSDPRLDARVVKQERRSPDPAG